MWIYHKPAEFALPLQWWGDKIFPPTRRTFYYWLLAAILQDCMSNKITKKSLVMCYLSIELQRNKISCDCIVLKHMEVNQFKRLQDYKYYKDISYYLFDIYKQHYKY